MRISTRGRYGLRALYELALAYKQGPVSMSLISDRQEISRKYLHALLTTLKDAGIVKAVRGAGGGYLLARKPSTITLKQILLPLEGSLCLVHCVADRSVCKRAGRCVARGIWQDLSKGFVGVLESLTLKDLVERGLG